MCTKNSAPNGFLCKRLLSDSQSFLVCRTAEMSWELISARMRWKQLRRTCLEDMWEEMGWDEMRWNEVRRAHMIWDEMKCGVWSASVKCEVRGVKSAVWGEKKVFAWRCMGPGSRTGHVLGQQACNRFARSTHRPGWRTAHAISIDEKKILTV